VVSVVVGNIAALKQTANMDLGQTSRGKRENDLDKLNRLDKQNQEKAQSKETKDS